MKVISRVSVHHLLKRMTPCRIGWYTMPKKDWPQIAGPHINWVCWCWCYRAIIDKAFLNEQVGTVLRVCSYNFRFPSLRHWTLGQPPFPPLRNISFPQLDPYSPAMLLEKHCIPCITQNFVISYWNPPVPGVDTSVMVCHDNFGFCTLYRTAFWV